MGPFYIVLATVAIRLVNFDSGKASHPYIVSIYNKHTGTTKGYQICAGSLITNAYVLTTRYCLPRHAYKIRYGDMKTTDYPTFSKILHRRYHPNSRPEIITSKRMNIKQVVSGSNNIALALVEKIPDQKFGRIIAIDYRTMIGNAVYFCTFDVSSNSSNFRTSSKKGKNEQINLENIFKRKKKMLREYFSKMNQAKRHVVHSRHILAHRGDTTPVMNGVIRFASGVVAPCEAKISMGPVMCVVEKCFDLNVESNRRLVLTPDYGTPLIYDGKIVGLAADVDEHYLKFTPISPFLNWINDYVKVESKNETLLKKRKRLLLI